MHSLLTVAPFYWRVSCSSSLRVHRQHELPALTTGCCSGDKNSHAGCLCFGQRCPVWLVVVPSSRTAFVSSKQFEQAVVTYSSKSSSKLVGRPSSRTALEHLALLVRASSCGGHAFIFFVNVCGACVPCCIAYVTSAVAPGGMSYVVLFSHTFPRGRQERSRQQRE